MPQVHVHNDNVHPYKEKFRDEVIVIPAKGFREMDADEAKVFLSTCNGVLRDADNQPDPAGFKMLRIAPLPSAPEPEAEKPKFVSHRDGKEFASQKALDRHLEQFKEQTVTDEVAEAALRDRKAKKTASR